MQIRYRQAKGRKEKSELLDEMVSTTGMNRDYLIHKIGHPIRRQTRSRERGKTYGPDVDAALSKIAQAQHHICAERLAGYLMETAENLAKHGKLYLDPHLREQLQRISVSTIRRHLKALPDTPRRPAQPAVPNSLQRQIAIRRIPWDVREPGYCEVDLVHHGGPDPRDQFGYTLQVIDVATGWSGRRAILGRSYVVVADALYTIFEQFPFSVVQLHVDNGSEFLNHLLIRFLQQFYPAIELLRSAPRHPNDNRFVEQKNYTLVRAFTGDWRLDTVAQTRFLNTIYALMDSYYNLWQPVFHQVEKRFVPAHDMHSAHTRRIHDRPIPPLERLIASGFLTPEALNTLRAQQHAIDLFALHGQILAKFQHLFAYLGADPNITENVFETLAHPELFPDAIAALDIEDAITNSNSDLTTIVKEVGLAVR
jgi:transposase InsO family protein